MTRRRTKSQSGTEAPPSPAPAGLGDAPPVPVGSERVSLVYRSRSGAVTLAGPVRAVAELVGLLRGTLVADPLQADPAQADQIRSDPITFPDPIRSDRSDRSAGAHDEPDERRTALRKARTADAFAAAMRGDRRVRFLRLCAQATEAGRPELPDQVVADQASRENIRDPSDYVLKVLERSLTHGTTPPRANGRAPPPNGTPQPSVDLAGKYARYVHR